MVKGVDCLGGNASCVDHESTMLEASSTTSDAGAARADHTTVVFVGELARGGAVPVLADMI